MLFTCRTPSRAAQRTAARKTIKRKNATLAVDLHCHVHTPRADEIAKPASHSDPLARYGNQRTMEHQQKLRAQLDRKLTSIEQRLADMDKMGIDVQAISSSPLQYYYGLDADLGRQSSRAINERLAEIVAAEPGRFVALGTAPLQEPSLAVAELEYCMNTLGFRGMELGTNVNGVELADPRYETFFSKAEALGAVLFLHPIGFTEPRRLTQHFLTNIIGNPLDTTVALAHIVFGGVLERHPRLKIVVAHGGGYMGHYPARMDHAYKVRPECPRSHQAAAFLLHEENVLRHDGFRPEAARAPREPLGRGPRRHRNRLSLRHGLLQTGGFRERDRFAFAGTERSDRRRQRGQAASAQAAQEIKLGENPTSRAARLLWLTPCTRPVRACSGRSSRRRSRVCHWRKRARSLR
jgi:aminocarboxymuconate-semialdehyde decarboxylase